MKSTHKKEQNGPESIKLSSLTGSLNKFLCEVKVQFEHLFLLKYLLQVAHLN